MRFLPISDESIHRDPKSRWGHLISTLSLKWLDRKCFASRRRLKAWGLIITVIDLMRKLIAVAWLDLLPQAVSYGVSFVRVCFNVICESFVRNERYDPDYEQWEFGKN